MMCTWRTVYPKRHDQRDLQTGANRENRRNHGHYTSVSLLFGEDSFKKGAVDHPVRNARSSFSDLGCLLRGQSRHVPSVPTLPEGHYLADLGSILNSIYWFGLKK